MRYAVRVRAPRPTCRRILPAAFVVAMIVAASCTSPGPDAGVSSTPEAHCDGDERGTQIPCCDDPVRVYYPLGQVTTDLAADAAAVLHEIAGEGDVLTIPAVPAGMAALYLEREGSAYAVVRYAIGPDRSVRIDSSTCVTMPGSEPPGPDPVVVTFLVLHDRPTAWVSLGDQVGEAIVGSYCWRGSGFVGCIDTAPLSEQRFPDLLQVQRGTELIVNGTAKRIAGSIAMLESPYEPVATLGLRDGSALLDVAPGRYVLSFEAHWPQGDVPIHVGIEIVA